MSDFSSNPPNREPGGPGSQQFRGGYQPSGDIYGVNGGRNMHNRRGGRGRRRSFDRGGRQGFRGGRGSFGDSRGRFGNHRPRDSNGNRPAERRANTAPGCKYFKPSFIEDPWKKPIAAAAAGAGETGIDNQNAESEALEVDASDASSHNDDMD